MRTSITPNLWFDTEAEEAARFYCSVFDNSRIIRTTRYPEGSPAPAGTVMTVEWEVDGQRFAGINGGAGGTRFEFDEAISFEVHCDTQEEVDRYWAALSDGGEEGACGWVKDRFGLWWQVTPDGLQELFAGEDPQRAARAMQAMLGMRKLDLQALRAAADGLSAA